MPTDNRVSSDAKENELTAAEKQTLAANGEIANDPNEGSIVHRVQYVDSAGTVGEKIHGPMPRGEWAAYSLKNGL